MIQMTAPCGKIKRIKGIYGMRMNVYYSHFSQMNRKSNSSIRTARRTVFSLMTTSVLNSHHSEELKNLSSADEKSRPRFSDVYANVVAKSPRRRLRFVKCFIPSNGKSTC